MALVEVKVPDIGDFKDVPVIEILVKAGDVIKPEDALVTLESDKATMDVPSPAAGTVKEIKVKVGDSVPMGSLLLLIEAEASASASAAQAAPIKSPPTPAPSPPTGGGARTVAAATPVAPKSAPAAPAPMPA